MNKSDTELYASLQDTPARRAAEKHFLEGATNALRSAGLTALELLAQNPDVSKIGLAQLLNGGATAIGLIMAIYGEAERAGAVREAAKDLLIRQIHYEFPHGWTTQNGIRPAVRLGSWRYELANYVLDPRVGNYASAILRALTTVNSPPTGWKPKLPIDSTIESLFETYWPTADARSGS